jgi:hypothetical protein
MTYLLGTYWPFILASLMIGVAIGWWNRDRRSDDDVAAWLEDGPDEP